MYSKDTCLFVFLITDEENGSLSLTVSEGNAVLLLMWNWPYYMYLQTT